MRTASRLGYAVVLAALISSTTFAFANQPVWIAMPVGAAAGVLAWIVSSRR